MKYVSPEYHEQLKHLGETLARRPEAVQDELDFANYAEAADSILQIPRPLYSPHVGFDSEGMYHDDDIRLERPDRS